MNETNPKQVKKIQQRYVVIGITAIVGVISLFLWLGEKEESSAVPTPEQTAKNFVSPLSQVNTEAYFMERAENRVIAAQKAAEEAKQQVQASEVAKQNAINEEKSKLEQLIALAGQSKTLYITDIHGSNVTVDLKTVKPWSNVNGTILGEILPGEIASYSPQINGTLHFVGSFLCLIPIANNHGIISKPITFNLKESKICSFSCDDDVLKRDLDYFFAHSPDHSRLSEIGIGTNEGITELCGKNASFEEKHCGIHFGLGGKAEDSFHLDMMMQNSTIKFDERLIFDGKFRI